MPTSVESLEPKAVWKYFARICQIPHGSGNEKALGEAIRSWVLDKGYECEIDAIGNILARIPGSKGLETAPTVVLQGHIDMVCEKNSDKEFDFKKDPITLVRDGDWITADGTTLGADNGIGVATALAFLDHPNAVHGPLELLMTVDEETGLTGARNLDSNFVKGRMLFNLDSEEDGIFYIGCAGGRDASITLPLKSGSTPAGQAYRLDLKGLRGGHSGMDIIHNRGNAIRLLARTIRTLTRMTDLSLAALHGGDKHNAIPREAMAVVVLPVGQEETLRNVIQEQLDGFRDEFASGDPDLSLTVSQDKAPAGVLTAGSRDAVLRLILGLPYGVLAMNRDIPGKVETSSNLARVRLEQDSLTILTASRSSIASAIDGVMDQIESVALANGATVDMDEGYPGWKPDLNSRMLARAKEVWRRVHHGDAAFEVVHAGLECGIIGERYPGMDMISLGPTIENPHSPDERLHIGSVQRFFDFVGEYIRALATE
ncbi:MAG: aminoacyl-histidine dipeptidase [Candidatus Eisenbacteria bacterium]|uniref:Cytosol non-specific dipeptidase n=1 Tax=Eiseniibacteriota bacterium TaxID=2212470 RepID=A0A948RW64_UNCEI|nr:aminoacyl-histidine dipeptidase [Candidatus Eisenbacteria bacterium]MBU1947861.1 aminoacyl-histidine dipeptidase [Candidatus Eisenbacteria bacterium]MBU2690779.1 aminoacyl-histidine dipeptidase [Candidatus Eisenbacteria bacterium]